MMLRLHATLLLNRTSPIYCLCKNSASCSSLNSIQSAIASQRKHCFLSSPKIYASTLQTRYQTTLRPSSFETMSQQTCLGSKMIRIDPLPTLDKKGPKMEGNCTTTTKDNSDSQKGENPDKCGALQGFTKSKKSESILPLDLLLKVSDVVKDQVKKGEFKTSEIKITEPVVPVRHSAQDEKLEATGSSPIDSQCDQCAPDSSNEDVFDVSALFSGRLFCLICFRLDSLGLQLAEHCFT